jgi:hypothetical protein
MIKNIPAHPLIFQLFEAAGISKRQIARQLGVSQPLVVLWSQGKRTISWSHFEALIDYAHQLAESTKGNPFMWDMPKLHQLSHQLADDLANVPLLMMQSDPRFEKAVHTLKEALGEEYCQEGPPIDVEVILQTEPPRTERKTYRPLIFSEHSAQQQEDTDATEDVNGLRPGKSRAD